MHTRQIIMYNLFPGIASGHFVELDRSVTVVTWFGPELRILSVWNFTMFSMYPFGLSGFIPLSKIMQAGRLFKLNCP